MSSGALVGYNEWEAGKVTERFRFLQLRGQDALATAGRMPALRFRWRYWPVLPRFITCGLVTALLTIDAAPEIAPVWLGKFFN